MLDNSNSEKNSYTETLIIIGPEIEKFLKENLKKQSYEDLKKFLLVMK